MRELDLIGVKRPCVRFGDGKQKQLGFQGAFAARWTGDRSLYS